MAGKKRLNAYVTVRIDISPEDCHKYARPGCYNCHGVGHFTLDDGNQYACGCVDDRLRDECFSVNFEDLQ